MTWRSSLGWFQDPYRVQVAFNYQSPFYSQVTAFPYNLAGTVRPANLEKIEPLFTVDLNLGYTLPDMFNSGIGGAQVDVSISNLLNTDPPFQDSASGLGAGSQIGRLISIALRKNF